MRLAVCALIFLASGVLSAQEPSPVVGAWDWNPTQGACPETHTYNADGTASVRSGNEVLEKTYTVTAAAGGMYLVTTVIVSTNGGRDCLGKTSTVGATSSVYIQPINGGGYYTCASEDGMSCYGAARPRRSPSDA
ncbi:MAG: hypothetical protein J0I72_02470 [Stenotrophomonas sp.]|jgi:hypothetical protein|nr:hypothetical protein [Xanthomonadales bacterium]MBN8768200.1 hypothetical protein [Stenotrophomonas sp.]